MTLSPAGLEFIKKAEGFRATIYDDCGHQAIGYGCDLTAAEVSRYSGLTISEADAEAMLRDRLKPVEAAITRLVIPTLTQGQHDALCSFAYNLGINALTRSTLLIKLNRGDFSGAAEEFLRWDHIGGMENPGLLARRKSEMAMFLGLPS